MYRDTGQYVGHVDPRPPPAPTIISNYPVMLFTIGRSPRYVRLLNFVLL